LEFLANCLQHPEVLIIRYYENTNQKFLSLIKISAREGLNLTVYIAGSRISRHLVVESLNVAVSTQQRVRGFITCTVRDEIKEYGVIRVCSTQGRDEEFIQSFRLKNLKGRDHCGDLGIVGRITIIWTLGR
jgi:hypothetical protein